MDHDCHAAQIAWLEALVSQTVQCMVTNNIAAGQIDPGRLLNSEVKVSVSVDPPATRVRAECNGQGFQSAEVLWEYAPLVLPLLRILCRDTQCRVQVISKVTDTPDAWKIEVCHGGAPVSETIRGMEASASGTSMEFTIQHGLDKITTASAAPLQHWLASFDALHIPTSIQLAFRFPDGTGWRVSNPRFEIPEWVLTPDGTLDFRRHARLVAEKYCQNDGDEEQAEFSLWSTACQKESEDGSIAVCGISLLFGPDRHQDPGEPTMVFPLAVTEAVSFAPRAISSLEESLIKGLPELAPGYGAVIEGANMRLLNPDLAGGGDNSEEAYEDPSGPSLTWIHRCQLFVSWIPSGTQVGPLTPLGLSSVVENNTLTGNDLGQKQTIHELAESELRQHAEASELCLETVRSALLQTQTDHPRLFRAAHAASKVELCQTMARALGYVIKTCQADRDFFEECHDILADGVEHVTDIETTILNHLLQAQGMKLNDPSPRGQEISDNPDSAMEISLP